jgi:hypothetical protein
MIFSFVFFWKNVYSVGMTTLKNEKKRYRHGIEISKTTKKKIKKADLLKRIEALESIVNGGQIQATSLVITTNMINEKDEAVE